MILFENFKQFLQLAVSNTQTVKQNAVLADTAYASAVAAHISALTPDQNLKLDTTNVSSTSGLLVSDSNLREIRFEPLGSGKVVQGFLEANISNVTKMWQRSDDAAGTSTTVPYGTLSDGRRYYVTDSDAGVFYLNEYGQIMGAIPGFGNTTTGYGTPVSAISFSILAAEYVAIVSSEHILTIWNAATFTRVAIFGTAGAAGLPSALGLDSPQDLAFNPTNSTLYVACAGVSMPPGASAPGFVASFDLSALPVVTFGQYVAINKGQSLHQGQVRTPLSLFYDSSLGSLWILSSAPLDLNRPFEIGALSVTGLSSNNFLKGYVEFRGPSYTLTSSTRIHVDVSRRRLYVTSSPGIEVFDLVTLKHLYTFGYFGVDESSDHPESLGFSPSTGAIQAVCSDILTVNGVQVNCALFNDVTNNRLVRIGENSYEGDNVVYFTAMTLTVPVALHGYLVKGSISSTKVQVEYRTTPTGTWQLLSQTDSVPSSLFFQFRTKIKADLKDIISSTSIKEIIVIGVQE